MNTPHTSYTHTQNNVKFIIDTVFRNLKRKTWQKFKINLKIRSERSIKEKKTS